MSNCEFLLKYLSVFGDEPHNFGLVNQLAEYGDPLGNLCGYLRNRGITPQCFIRESMCALMIQYLMQGCKNSFIDELILGVAERISETERCEGGSCYDISRIVVNALNDLGIPAKVEEGWFQLDEPDEYNESRFLYEDDPSKAIHFWIVVNGKILDLTYGQFVDEIDDTYPPAGTCLLNGDAQPYYPIVYDYAYRLPRYHVVESEE